MLLLLACCVAVAAAAPVTYDQRQDGEANLHADIKNIAIFAAIPKELSIPLDILDGLIELKSKGREASEDKGDVKLMEAFIKPSSTYKVEIGPEGSERSVSGEARTVEVVIAGRRRSDVEPQHEEDKIKVPETTEQREPIQPEKAPEVKPSS